ncbi:MAG: flagellar biosynthesis protein FlhA [Candidatus Tectimicrobiota bacterium]|nr:MAG: flagellar biosynthesis protein FlhA [Candidatus Tectomicrobia bacterium]
MAYRPLSLQALASNTDLLVAGGIIAVLLVMILPLPPQLLDLLLALNITLSLVTLLVAVYTLQPLEFSVFPSLLLMLTLLRLSLNVASTRLILLHGNQGPGAAGEVIRSFGSFVVGGNFLVGLIVFSILVLINFVVITRGAGRIAEVAARFTLDAMPGKQMAIDADLNAGLISEQEARQRRQAIQQEADFYGAMDGASKFVRGDAIAGILITLVNVLGGIVIGVAQQGMGLQEALQSYTILTVGDGLASQVPALIISTAAGIVVTKVSGAANLGEQVRRQLLVHPRALGTAAGILLLLGLVPGLPKLPLLVLAAGTGAVAYYLGQRPPPEPPAAAEPPPASKEALPDVADLLTPVDLLELEVGYGLIPLVDAERHGELLERIRAMRVQIAQELGVMVPPLRIRDNLQLKPGEYTILLKGEEVARGELMLGRYLAMYPGAEPPQRFGIPTREPAFGLPAYWVSEEEKEAAQLAGYTVVDLATVVITHLTEVVKTHIHELLSREDVQKLLQRFAQDYPKVVEELVPTHLSLGGVQKVLQNLLREQIPIRDLLTILETLADYAPHTKDPLILTEYVRQRLARTITKKWQTPEGEIPVVVLAHDLETTLSKAIQHTEQGTYLVLEPQMAQRLLAELGKVVEQFAARQLPPIVLTGPLVRAHLRRLVEPYFPQLVVLSQNELVAGVRIRNLGVVKV